MKKSASILDYSYPFLDPAVWDEDMKLYSYHKDFILRLLNDMYVNYKLKQPELWITDIRIIGSLTTSKWLFTSDMDVHMVVNLTKFIEINMPGTDPKVAYDYLDSTRKEFDRAKILAPMTQHPIEYYFEIPEFVTTNTSVVGVYSISQDKWLKDPVIFDADLDFEESKKQVMTQAEAIAEALDGSFGKIDRQIKRIDELELMINAWPKDKQQLFYDKIEEKLKAIEAEIAKDLELRQALIDARHTAQDPMADIEIKFKWLQRFGFFGILSNLKNLMKETDGQVTMQELPLIKKIVTDSVFKDAFLKEAFTKETETDICVDLDKTIAKPAKFPEIGEPIEGAKEALEKMQELGYNVIIYSCRTDEEGGVDLIKEYLDKHDIPYDSIFEGEKPFAKFYIDDHAIKFDNWDNVLKQVEKSDKKASLSITASDWPESAWIAPDGQLYPASSHDTWVATNGKLLKEKYNFDTSKFDQEDMWDCVRLLIRAGWSRLSMAPGGKGYMIEVADLRAVPQVVFDMLINSPVEQFILEQADSYAHVQLSKDELMDGQNGVNKAMQRQRMQGSKAFSKRYITAHKYDVLGDPSLRQGQPRAVFNFVQPGIPEMNIPDTEMFDILGDHPRFGSTVSRNTLKELNIPITEDRVAKQAQTRKIKQGDYSCVMALVPHDLAQEIVAWGVRNVPDEDIYLDGDKFGRELESHVTIKYGLFTDDGKPVRRSFNNSKPFKAKLGKVRHFEPPELPFDVLTIEVISEDLQKANAMICDKFECEEGLVSDEYKPHITIAYMKRGEAKEYVGADEFEGKEIVLDTIIFSPNKGNRTYFSIGTDKESSLIMEKTADFLPSMAINAPDNDWQFAEGGDDLEIALQPDSVSDDTTEYEPCTTGKPRTKEVWRQFISMFSNLFSKNDTRKIESYDKELEETEKNELGEDQTALEYSKDFTDLNLKKMPHNTTWDSLTQDGEPSKPTSVTYSPQISNDDNLDQNSPGGFPRRFMGKPKGEWFSNDGEIIPALENMFKNKEAAIDSMTTDITKVALTRQYALYVGGRLAIRTLTRSKAVKICRERFPNEFATGNYEIKEEAYVVSKQAGCQSASVPDYLMDEWKTEQINDDTDEAPYINHDQRDYPYGMHDSPENTGTGIGWPKDNTRAIVRLDTLENPAFRLDPFGIGEYNVTYYTGMPMSDGIEQMNQD